MTSESRSAIRYWRSDLRKNMVLLSYCVPIQMGFFSVGQLLPQRCESLGSSGCSCHGQFLRKFALSESKQGGRSDVFEDPLPNTRSPFSTYCVPHQNELTAPLLQGAVHVHDGQNQGRWDL